MKRALSVLIICLLLIGFGTYELLTVGNAIKSLQSDVDNFYIIFPEQQQSIAFLEPQVLKQKKQWEQKEPILCVMFNHKDLSLVTDTLNRFYSYVQLDNYEEAKVELNLLKMQANKTTHNMGFNLQNIF